jgi:uncharacterized protein YndB with AHSA1/START domain
MEKIILVKENFECEVSIVFKYFTVNSLLEDWLTEKADVDPKVGGKFELFWDPHNREINSTIGCVITGIEKNRFLSFNWKGPLEFQSIMNIADPLTHIIVFFSIDDKDPKKTVIHLFHTGWRSNLEWQKARAYFENAWSKALEKLKEKVKNNF